MRRSKSRISIWSTLLDDVTEQLPAQANGGKDSVPAPEMEQEKIRNVKKSRKRTPIKISFTRKRQSSR